MPIMRSSRVDQRNRAVAMAEIYRAVAGASSWYAGARTLLPSDDEGKARSTRQILAPWHSPG